ncbi:MAG: hypothetical protein IPM98_00410 [Lewinellaceae bacterium]|nr:hypothetical protein [Lewinellaceae bacterium]
MAGLRAELQARGLVKLDGYNLTVRKSGKSQPLPPNHPNMQQSKRDLVTLEEKRQAAG